MAGISCISGGEPKGHQGGKKDLNSRHVVYNIFTYLNVAYIGYS